MSTRVSSLWHNAANFLSQSPYIIWILFGLALIRAIVSLIAYPPALGADSYGYFFYAERFAGLDIPEMGQVVPPLYPFLILVTYKWLGSVYLLIFLQFIMSAAIVPLYYDALKKIDPVIALLSSFIILLDFQTAVVFNFLSTEPLYVFLLAVSFNLFMRVAAPAGSVSWLMFTASAGSLMLLQLTRAVGRFIIIPLAFVLLLQSRNWKHLVLFVGSFGIMILAYFLFSQLLFSQAEGMGSSTYMLSGVMRNSPVSPENGPASAEYVRLQELCNGMKERRIHTCYLIDRGTTDGLASLLINTAIETIQANIGPYTSEMWLELNKFLKLSGQQVGLEPGIPSSAQCTNVDEEIAALTLDDTYDRGWSWAWGARNYIDNNFEEFRSTWGRIKTVLCPPMQDSEPVRDIVNYLSFRYRSLGRPNPMLWYGALLVLTGALPWARRKYLTLVLTANIFLFNHALVSAIISNVQPRYVVVTNPFRTILLVTLGFIIMQLILQLVRRFLPRRAFSWRDQNNHYDVK